MRVHCRRIRGGCSKKSCSSLRENYRVGAAQGWDCTVSGVLVDLIRKLCLTVFMFVVLVTKGIVDLHHGHITVASPGEGFGSTFTVQIPLYRRLNAAGNNESQVIIPEEKDSENCSEVYTETSRNATLVGRRSSSIVAKNSIRILVVDDAKLNRKMTRNILKSRCGHIDEAVDGEDAVVRIRTAMLTNSSYHMILMENLMPKMSGPEAAKEMRALGYRGMIIGVTGCATAEEMDFFVRHGANCVLKKPLDFDMLDGLLQGE